MSKDKKIREDLLAGLNAGRELAALTDGPWIQCWYWRDEFETHQQAARDTHSRGGTVRLGSKAKYQPTARWVAHPDPECAGIRGRAWTFDAEAA